MHDAEPKMSLIPQFQPLPLSSLCASRILSSHLPLSPLPSSLEATLSRLSSLQGRWSLLSRQERVVRDDGSPASLAEMHNMSKWYEKSFYSLLELNVLSLRPGVWKLRFYGMDGPRPCVGPTVPWWNTGVDVLDVRDTSVLEGPTELGELGPHWVPTELGELGPQTWVDLSNGTLNTLWGVRHYGRNDEEESGDESGNESEDEFEDARESEPIENIAVNSVGHHFPQHTIDNFYGLVYGIKVAVKKLIGMVDEEKERGARKDEEAEVENSLMEEINDNSLVNEDKESEVPIVLEEHFHLVSLSLEREELVVKVHYGQRGKASKMITLHYQEEI